MTQTFNPEIPSQFLEEFQPRRLVYSLVYGLLLGVIEIVFAISVGSLIFSGDLAIYLPYGISIALVTASIMLSVVSLGSSLPGVAAVIQFSPAVILAVIATSIFQNANNATFGLANVLVTIALSSVLTGLFFLALGYFRLGGLVRYLPYPVVGGFLAGTGWLVVLKSFDVMAGYPLGFSTLGVLFQFDQLILWLPGLFFALLMFVALRRIKHSLAVPAILVLAILTFYLTLPVVGISFSQAMERGLLMGDISISGAWQSIIFDNLRIADWPAIIGQSGNIAVILLISVVSLLLNASALELVLNREADLNRELRVAGLANLLAGLAGGAVGYQALNLSTLGYRIGARGRLHWMVAALVCVGILFAGAPVLAYFPVPVLGALLFYMGLGFLYEWVIDGWKQLSRADYLVVILILVVIGATDFLIGVGVGLVAMVILFVLNYSQINVVRHALSGAEMQSNVQRSSYHQRVLSDLGKQIYILELQGFIFFGTANTLLEQIKNRMGDRKDQEVRFILLDFRRVTGLDSSAAMSFAKARKLAGAQDITLVLTHMAESVRRLFEANGLVRDQDRLRVFPDLDHGLEWCENQLLANSMVTRVMVPTTLRAQLSGGGFNKDDTPRLTEFFEKVHFKEGEYLARQGEQSDDMYFIEFGEGAVYLEMDGGKKVRLQTIDAGTVVGEMGLYLDARRTASVIANTPMIAYRFTRDRLARMKIEEPELAAAFHEYIIRLLSERLMHTTRMLEAVLK